MWQLFIGVLDLVDNTLAYGNGGHLPAAILSDEAVVDSSNCRASRSACSKAWRGNRSR